MKNIKDLIPESYFENKEYEYKLVLESQEAKIEKWAKTLVGFSNEIGGTILVGVNNDGDIVGLSRDDIDNAKNLVLRTIDRHIFPHIDVKFDIFGDAPSFVLAIKVDYTNNIIVYKTGDFNEKVYVRADGATVPANVNQIIKLSKRRYGVDNTILDVLYLKNKFSKFFFLARIYREDNTEPTEKMLISKEVIKGDGRITSGFNMFSNDYSDDDTLIKCRLWDGFDKGGDKVIDRKEFKGSIPNVLEETINFIVRNSKTGFIKMGMGRLDTYSYPEIAIREALVNAIAHRDYSIDGTQIDVDIFKDRIQIMSPGKWLPDLDPKDYQLNKIPSVRRNRIICNCFELMGLMEQGGTGFKKISEAYSKLPVKQPEVESTSATFIITMYDVLYDGLPNVESTIISSKYDEDILNFCYNDARSREEIQNHIGYKSRTSFSSKIIKPLVDNKLLIPLAPARSNKQKFITNKEKYKL